MINCPYCKKDIPENLNFCLKCGKQIVSKNKLKINIESINNFSPHKIKITNFVSGLNYRKYLIPGLSGIGLIVIILSLLSIFEIKIDSIDILNLVYGGYAIGIFLILTSIFFYRLDRFDRSIITTLLLFSESIIFLSSFILDIIERNTMNRYILLITAILVSFIALSSVVYLDESNYQLIHRVIGIYIAWITIFYLGGSTFISSGVYTAAILMLLVVFVLINIFYPSLPVLGSFMIMEFIVFLNTPVINSTYLFYIILFHIILIPLLLYLFDTIIKLEEYIQDKIKILISLYFIPLFSLFIPLGRGALLSPYPHILLAVFGIVWSLYFMRVASIDTSDKDMVDIQNIALITTIIMYFVHFIFILNAEGTNLIIIYIGILIITSILRKSMSEKMKFISRLIPLFNSIFLVYQLYLEENMSMNVTVGLYIITVVLSYITDIKKLKYLNEKEITLIIFNFSIFIGLHYLLKPTSIYLVSVIFPVLLGIYYLLYKIDIPNRYIVISISYSFVALMSYFFHIDYYLENVIQIMILSVIVFLLGIIDRPNNIDSNFISWIIISLPIVFGLSLVENHYILNLFFMEMFIFALGTLYFSIKKQTSIIWFYLFYMFGFLGRVVQFGEISQVFRFGSWNIGIWTLTVSISYSVLGLVMIIFRIIREDKWYLSLGLISIWLSMGLTVVNFADKFKEFFLSEYLWVIMQIGLTIYLMIDFYAILRNVQFDSTLLIHYSGLGILNFILMSSIESEYKNILWLLTLVTMVISVFQLHSEFNQISLYIWLVSVTSNLIQFSFYNEFTIDIMLVSLFIILTTSKFTMSIFRINETRKQVLDLMVYVLLSIIVYVFIRINALPVIHALASYYLVTITALLVISKSESKFANIIQGIVFLFFSSLFMGFEQYEIYIFVANWMVSIIVIALNWNELTVNHKIKYIPEVNYMSISQSTINIMLTLISVWYLINKSLINEIGVNQWLSLLMFVILVSTIIYEKFANSNYFTDGIVISSFIILIGSSLIGFFTTATSNIILGSIAILIVIFGIMIDENKLLRVGIAVSLISIIKFIIDRIIMDNTIDRALSGLIIGVQAIFYAIVYSAYIKESKLIST